MVSFDFFPPLSCLRAMRAQICFADGSSIDAPFSPIVVAMTRLDTPCLKALDWTVDTNTGKVHLSLCSAL